MPRPGSESGKTTIKGGRGNDIITVTETGVVVNGRFKPFSEAAIDSGFVIRGEAGNDTINGGRGPDEIFGGSGNDRLVGGGGLDRLTGDAGDDVLVDLDELVLDPDLEDKLDPNAEKGAVFDGGLGTDTIDFSGASAAVGVHLHGLIEPSVATEYSNGEFYVHHYAPAIEGRIAGVENLIGSAHGDVLWGESGANVIRGGGGDDYLVGLRGDDQLWGDDGRDYLAGSAGNDRLTGGTGADVFEFEGEIASVGSGQDIVLDYAPGSDVLRFVYTEAAPVWQAYSYSAPNDSLIGIYGNGQSSVIVVGITDVARLTIQVMEGQGMWDVYHFSLPEPEILG